MSEPPLVLRLRDPEAAPGAPGRSPADMLALLGPRIAVTVALHPEDAAQRLARGEETLPAPITVPGQLDTGADGTSVDPQLMRALGIESVGERDILNNASNQVTTVLIYPCRLFFPDVPGVYFDLAEGVTGGLIPQEPAPFGGNIGVLIGRDVLRFCRLTVDGPRGLFTLEVDAPPASISPETP